MLAYFGTDVDRGESAVGVDVDGMMGVGAEGGDEVRGCGGIEVSSLWDMVEELATDKFFRGKPDVATGLVVDCVLVRVVVGREARWGSKKILEWADVDGRLKYGDRSDNG